MIDAYRLPVQPRIDLLIILIWISLSKLYIGDGFPGINSAAQINTVGYSFLVLDMNGFFYKIKISVEVLIASSSMKGSQSVLKTQFLTNVVLSYIYPLCILCFCRRRVPNYQTPGRDASITLPLVLGTWQQYRSYQFYVKAIFKVPFFKKMYYAEHKKCICKSLCILYIL